ncbi:DUF1993 family protein [Bordetella sp. BOR01]|uniref:DUF1993 domain-containing protein n=1 Tax=Bordetella sp. BOR01 TaxID=2854779 RepID=UPI001C472741|nr:DUF1993 domain-containing protein [Bordetella sp. BOR01]MBV7486879.1 DUF1993 domain-containing protein [Bordetella sp. BOR01]
MAISMYQASVPVFARALQVLSGLLDKGAEHARSQGQDPDALVRARLAPDMLTLAGQVQRASDSSKLALQRLTGIEAPRFADDESTCAQLQRRIADTLAYVNSVTEDQLAEAQAREVVIRFKDFEQSFRGDAYLLSFALPNFFFHITTAYDILRHEGVPLGKRDYLGPYR